MTITESLKIEDELRVKDQNTILLFKENGNSAWYRAYERSALLMEFYPNGLNENQRLKPTKKSIKIDDKSVEIIQVGIQLPSLDKYLPGVQPIADNSDIVKIRIEPYDVIELQNWKDSIPLKENKPQQVKQNNPTVYSQPATFTSIMKAILGFQTYKKNEEELITFIESLRERCAQLI